MLRSIRAWRWSGLPRCCTSSRCHGCSPTISPTHARADAAVREPLTLIVLGKAAAHWLVTGLPLTLMSLVFGVAFDIGIEEAA